MDENRAALKYGRNWYADRVMFLSRKCQGCLFPCDVVVVLHSIHGDDVGVSDLFPRFVCVRCAVAATRQREVIALATAYLERKYGPSNLDTEWRLSYRGNATRMLNGLRITVFPLSTACTSQPGLWAVSVDGKFYKPFKSKADAMEASASLVENHVKSSISVGVSMELQMLADPAWENVEILKPEMESPAHGPAKFAATSSDWD